MLPIPKAIPGLMAVTPSGHFENKIDPDDSPRVLLSPPETVSELENEIKIWNGKLLSKPNWLKKLWSKQERLKKLDPNAKAALELMIARFEWTHKEFKAIADSKADHSTLKRQLDQLVISTNAIIKRGGLIFSSSRKGVFINAQFARDFRRGSAAVAYLLGSTQLEGFAIDTLATKDHVATRTSIALAQDALATTTQHWE